MLGVDPVLSSPHNYLTHLFPIPLEGDPSLGDMVRAGGVSTHAYC